MSGSSAAKGAGGTRPPADRPSIRPATIDVWVDWARRRLGVNSALVAACRAGLWLLPLLALLRFGLLRSGSTLAAPIWMCALAALCLVTVFALAYLRRPSRLASAAHLDECLPNSGVASALELRQLGPSPYLQLALERTETELRLRAHAPWVLPIRRPKELAPLLLVLAAFVAALAIRPEPPHRALVRPAPAQPDRTAPLRLPEEELALLERRAQRLLSATQSERGRQRALEYAQLIERLKSGTLDQRQALSAAAALEREIQEEASARKPNGERGDPERTRSAPPTADAGKEKDRKSTRLNSSH